ncbi:hypothetical protein LB823_23145 [Tsukamurella sp. M9C]|uniref:hypothetical protein n=1 Tax=unclassified Tsukamurella TaxID=2633480 RepID=UPI001CCE891E|nr:hypothetical protein [Tsukamurella sp. M9C]MCA0159107.1 hypothetical protein [Tsukamurella sp. M9C]
MTDDAPDVIAQLRQMLTDAEEREDPVDAAWARHALAVATKVVAQMDAVEALILSLIPTRERGAITALVMADAMLRLTAAVDAAFAQAKRTSDEMADRG